MVETSDEKNTIQIILWLLGDIYQMVKTMIKKLSKTGMYEVLNYETKVELLDPKGENAIVSKMEEVRFLQDNIIAFQDQAWGDGKILIDYCCSPGYPVDFYRSGHKTIVLISLRDVKKRGDVSKYKMKWKINNGFRKELGFWATDINHLTKNIKIEVVFPVNRPPKKVSVVESNTQKIEVLNNDVITHLPDKKWAITWEKKNPQLNEHYILKWEW